MSPRLLPVVAALCLGWSASCAGTEVYPEVWKSDELEVPSERLLWEVTVMVLDKEQFPVGSQVDPTTLTALSGWRNNLAPWRYKGYRERAAVRYEQLGPQLYRIEVRVEREVNNDPIRPMDLSYADWQPGPDNEQAALVLIQRIRSWIRPGLEMRADQLRREQETP